MENQRKYVLLAVFLLIVGKAVADNCHHGWYYHGGNCYGFGEDTVTWANAEEYCRLYGSHLAEIDSADENNFLKNLSMTKQAAGAWVGGTDIFSEGYWEWVNSKQPIYAFTDWGPNEPNNVAGEDCLMLYAKKNYQWNDQGCEQLQNFICEVESDGNIIVG